MKKPITVRVEADLLADARRCATQENRTLTNFIETVLRRRIDEMAREERPGRRRSSRRSENGTTNVA